MQYGYSMHWFTASFLQKLCSKKVNHIYFHMTVVVMNELLFGNVCLSKY